VAQAPALSASLGAHKQAYEEALRQLDAADFERRLLAKDASIWSGDEAAISQRLGWLTVPQGMLGRVRELAAFADDVKQAGFERIVLLGMGCSSLAPEVMSGTFGAAPGRPALALLDTTDGATITETERVLDRERTLFVVSSKSGTTTDLGANR
jgi:glucose-6-phosphate isomerase